MNNYTPLISPYISLKLCLTDRIDLLITIVTKTKPQTDSYLILFSTVFLHVKSLVPATVLSFNNNES